MKYCKKKNQFLTPFFQIFQKKKKTKTKTNSEIQKFKIYVKMRSVNMTS